jgi:ferredoxin
MRSWKLVMKKKTVFMVYFSPAGSTRHAAAVMEKQLLSLGAVVTSFDLAERNADAALTISRQIAAANDASCLFVGSPVYVSRAAPPVMTFIDKLQESAGALAVPFVTWGGASSGIALYEMGKALKQKKFTLLGAAKILAVHSLMWRLDDALGKGHPDADDDRLLEKLAIHIQQKLQQEKPTGIRISDLAYQSEENHRAMEKIGIQDAKMHMPERIIDTRLCNQCQVCAEVCPTDSVAFTPYPEFDDGCVFCFNCMKKCPERAIQTDFSEIWQRIRDRAAAFCEQPYSQTFLSAK